MNILLKFIKRFLILFLGVFLYLNYNIEVKADTSTLSKNIVDGIYANTILGNGEEHHYYLDIYKMGSKTVYCIEPGTDITESIYYDTSDLSSLPYSNDVIDYIKMVAFFGYDYFDHQSIYYYMAAQELIWEAIGNDVYWSTTFDHGGEINIRSYKSDINSLIQTRDNFSLTDINLDVNNYDGQVIYRNNELFRYEIIDSSIPGITLDYGVLTIPNNHNLEGQSITFRHESYTYDGALLFYNGTSQKMMSGGNLDFPLDTVTLHTKKGNLNIYKYDIETKSNVVSGNGSLEGAVYELYNYDYSKIGEYVTDEKGEIKINNLEYGTYYLKEISSSKGYLLDDTMYTVEINDDNNELIAYEKPIYGSLEIVKTYGDNHVYENEVTFDIYDDHEKLFDSITTDENGYTEILLPFGEYLIRQRNGLDGYLKVTDFKVDIDGSKEVYTYSLNDEKMDEPEEYIINPKTFDDIGFYLDVLVISFLLLVSGIFLYRKYSNNL